MPICILAYKIISSKSVIVKFYKSFLQYFRATLNEYRPIRFVVENFTGRNMVADNFTAELKSQRVKLLVISPFTSFFISFLYVDRFIERHREVQFRVYFSNHSYNDIDIKLNEYITEYESLFIPC